MLSMSLEHLPDEPGRGPVAHNNFSTGTADPLQFRGDSVEVGKQVPLTNTYQIQLISNALNLCEWDDETRERVLQPMVGEKTIQ